MENYQPQNFKSTKAEDFLAQAIAAEKEKMEKTQNSPEKEKQTDEKLGNEEQREPELGGDIEIIPAEDGKENASIIENEEMNGNAKVEKEVEAAELHDDPENLFLEGNVEEMIRDGESIQKELIISKNKLIDEGKVESEDYRNIDERIEFIEEKLKKFQKSQIEKLKSEIEEMNRDVQGNRLMDKYGKEHGFDEKATHDFVENQVKNKEERIRELEMAISPGKKQEKKIEKETAEAPEPEDPAAGRKVEVVEEKEDKEEKADEQEEKPKTIDEQAAAGTQIENEQSAEELSQNAERSYQDYLEAQKRFYRAKGRIGMMGRVRQKLGLAGREKKEELDQLKDELDAAKAELSQAEKVFKQEHKIYANYLVEQKKQKLIEQDQKRCKEANWSEEKLEKRLQDYKKTQHFKDAIKMFIISDATVEFRSKTAGEGDKVEEHIEKLSLLEDMNRKLMAVDQAKIEALDEHEKNILQKSWDWYRKLPKSKKLAYGVAFAAPLSAGAALASGATAGVVLGAAAFGGSRKLLSSVLSMAAGGMVYKKMRSWQQRKQPGRERAAELKMVKEISKDREIDLYSFMKDRLAQEKKDNYKSLAAAGITGAAIGGGLRFTDLDVWEAQGWGSYGKQVETNATGMAGDGIEGESLDADMSRLDEIKLNQGIRDSFNAKMAEAIGGEDRAEGFALWKEMRQELIENGHEETQVFQELEKTYGEDAYQKYLEAQNQTEAHQEETAQETERQKEDAQQKPDTGTEEDPGAGAESAETADVALTAEEYIKGVEDMRKGGRMPGLQQMRDYKHALMAEKNGVDFVPKGQLPEDVVEKIIEARESEPGAATELSDEKLEELAGNEAEERMSQEEYLAQAKDEAETAALRGKEPDDRMSPEEFGAWNKSAGAGEEFGAGYDPKLQELVAEDSQADMEGEIENVGELKDFGFELAKGDVLWSKLEEQMNGNELIVAEKLNDFRIDAAKKLVQEQGFDPGVAQKYVHWRFENLQPGDAISFKEGKLDIANFADKGNVDVFLSKFGIETGAEHADTATPDDPKGIETDRLDQTEDQLLASENEKAGFFEKHLTALQRKSFDKLDAEKMLALSNKPSSSTAINSAENIGRRFLKAVEQEIGPPKKGETALAYLDRFPKDFTAQQIRGIDSILNVA